MTLLDVEEVPQVHHYGQANRKYGEDAVHFRRPCASHEDSGGD